MPIIDLNQLPAPDVVEELDFETILAERKATLISLYPEDQQEAVARTLTLESEPLVKLLEENAYRELIWRQRVNEAARAVMLACAAGNDLDVIGANYNTTRLIITPADDSGNVCVANLITLVLDKIMWLSNLRRGKSSNAGTTPSFPL